jgi:hypothetical protein
MKKRLYMPPYWKARRSGGRPPSSTGERSVPSIQSGGEMPTIESRVGPTSWVEAK